MSPELRGVRSLRLTFGRGERFNANADEVLRTVSEVKVREEPRTRFFSGGGCSVVQATVRVTTGTKPFFTFKARLLAKLKLEGDVLRSPERVKALVGARLVALVERYSSAFIVRNLVETEAGPLVTAQ